MARTNESQVRDIFSAHAEGTALSDEAVDFWVDAANDFVTAHLDGEGLSDSVLQRIEALVACHGIASGDPTESSFAEGDIRGEFEGSGIEREGLYETRFGRRAIMLDTTGVLSTAGKDTAEFHAYGVD